MIGGGCWVAGYWRGSSDGLTQAAPLAHLSPGEAEAWATLMRNNSAVAALQACRDGKTQAGKEDGRLACWMPVWLEPAAPPAR